MQPRNSGSQTMNENSRSEQHSKLVHDMRHCLHAMRMGRETLAKLYGDEKIIEVCALMELEEQKLLLLLDDLIESVSKKASSQAPV
jgi:hypothetical protein